MSSTYPLAISSNTVDVLLSIGLDKLPKEMDDLVVNSLMFDAVGALVEDDTGEAVEETMLMGARVGVVVAGLFVEGVWMALTCVGLAVAATAVGGETTIPPRSSSSDGLGVGESALGLMDGEAVGDAIGLAVGPSVMGLLEGAPVGDATGPAEGVEVGFLKGEEVGDMVGLAEGVAVGLWDGNFVGLAVGKSVLGLLDGTSVGVPMVLLVGSNVVGLVVGALVG
mmetsp:Transcript_13440/g.27218  ORF Transcript_13440/g.27218 Transcript_13440/m.27218 type:complete len:224 (-) Transcript_13440:554-1225(-)